MAPTNTPGSPNPNQEQLANIGYETRDIAINTLSRWLIGLFAFIGVATFGTLGLYKLLVPTYAETERVSPLENVRTYPPNPQLQTRPKHDIIEYRAAEAKQENGYTKGENGTVNIPVERAIDLLAARGISGVKGGTAAPGTAAPASNEPSGNSVSPEGALSGDAPGK